jgi:radical SAM protein with 4Fe4S-binding SPASM domain
MILVLNPDLTITKQGTTILLHSRRLIGTCTLQRISSAEAMILALHDGIRDEIDIRKALIRQKGFSEENANIIMKMIDHYIKRSILVDIDSVRDESRIKVYDPLDFAYNVEYREHDYIDKLDQPLDFTYIVTMNCNRLCRYCYANAKPFQNEELISFQRLTELIDEASNLGIPCVNISGGEPFLRPDFIDIIEYMLAMDIYPIISTKSALSEDIVKRLKVAGLEDIQISLDSPDPETANFLVGSASFYQDAIKTIQLLVSNEIRVRLNYVCTSYNIKQIPALLKLATKMGVSEIWLSPYYNSLGRHSDDLFLSSEDRRYFDFELPKLIPEYPELKISGLGHGSFLIIPEETGLPRTIGPCSVGINGFVMRPDGKVTICERLATDPACIVGDLNNQSIMDMWSSIKWNPFRYPVRNSYIGTECATCKDFDRCIIPKRRCFVNTKIVYNRLFGPEPSCPKLKVQSLI